MPGKKLMLINLYINAFTAVIVYFLLLKRLIEFSIIVKTHIPFFIGFFLHIAPYKIGLKVFPV